VAETDETVGEILRRKQVSIKNAHLEEGAPTWQDILDLPFKEIDRRARQGLPGYRTIRKLLTDCRFDR
jgi:hypothetical protein